MSRARVDLTGQKFGRLTVVGMAGTDAFHKSLCRVECECGKAKTVRSSSLKSGDVQSCGSPGCRACKYSIEGEPLRRYCARTGLNYFSMRSRILDKCMTPEEAVERPVRPRSTPAKETNPC